MSLSRGTRVDAFAAGMSPLLAFIPGEIARASGADEDQALLVAWCSLPLLTAVALALRATAWGKQSYAMAVFRESFSMANYLRDLALWSAFYAIGLAALWFYLPR